jgi:hypothetical protein
MEDIKDGLDSDRKVLLMDGWMDGLESNRKFDGWIGLRKKVHLTNGLDWRRWKV